VSRVMDAGTERLNRRPVSFERGGGEPLTNRCFRWHDSECGEKGVLE
jgi:hypothetical protein